MTDPRHERPREPRDRADERFVVERPEILGGAAAARQDDDVERGELREAVERRDHRLRRPRPLDERRREDDLDARVAPRDHGL